MSGIFISFIIEIIINAIWLSLIYIRMKISLGNRDIVYNNYESQARKLLLRYEYELLYTSICKYFLNHTDVIKITIIQIQI